MRYLKISILLVVASCQCSPRKDDGGKGGGSPTGTGGGAVDTTLVALSVTPNDVALDITAATPKPEVTFTVQGTLSNGTKKDVTQEVVFDALDIELGSMKANRFTASGARAGISTVAVRAGKVQTFANVKIQLKRTLVEPGLPSDIEEKFSGAPNAQRAPQILYPNPGVMVPPNMNGLEFHFRPQPGTEFFQLRFESGLVTASQIFTCSRVGDGCVVSPDDALMKQLRGSARGRDVDFTILATSKDDPSVGISTKQKMYFSQDDIAGTLYYWTTSSIAGAGKGAIMRFDFASETQRKAEAVVTPKTVRSTDCTPQENQTLCVGCHALSRDGSKMAVITEICNDFDGSMTLIDVKTSKVMGTTPIGAKGMFQSWNPESSKFVTTYYRSGPGGPGLEPTLKIVDGESGVQLEQLTGTGTQERPAAHPDWSQDGRTIAYTRVGTLKNGTEQSYSLQEFWFGSIWAAEKDDAGWKPPVEWVPQEIGKNRYYPALAPSNDFLVYDESICPTDAMKQNQCDTDTDPTAKLWAAKLGAAPIELKRANAKGAADVSGDALANSFPKWSPFVFQRTGEVGSRLLWLTFSSTRVYGLKAPPKPTNPRPGVAGGTYIWMVAIDPDAVLRGEDGSYGAFVVPFQDLDTSNHIAQWTTKSTGPIQPN